MTPTKPTKKPSLLSSLKAELASTKAELATALATLDELRAITLGVNGTYSHPVQLENAVLNAFDSIRDLTLGVKVKYPGARGTPQPAIQIKLKPMDGDVLASLLCDTARRHGWVLTKYAIRSSADPELAWPRTHSAKPSKSPRKKKVKSK